MFEFNTTTVINSTQDFTSKVIDKTTGKPGLPLFSGQGEQTTESGKPVYANFSVKRHLTFKQPFVKAIYYREHNDPQLAKVEIKLDSLDVTEPKLYRIAMYVRLEGSANEYYANDFVFKGKPFFIEFTTKKNEEPADIAKKIEKIAKKYMQMLYEYPLINVTAEGTKVVIEATDEYQRFKMVELQEFSDEAGLVNGCCGKSGDFVMIEELNVDAADASENTGNIVWATEDDELLKGKMGFGTYRHIIKDLRLPTPDNLRWGHIIADETPIPGATYDQYTIYYCKRVGVQGLAHVGDVVTALTGHIFYVNTNVKTEWEEALNQLGVDITEVVNDQYTLTPDELEIQAAKDAAQAQQTTDTTQTGGINTNSGDISEINDQLSALEARIAALEE